MKRSEFIKKMSIIKRDNERNNWGYYTCHTFTDNLVTDLMFEDYKFFIKRHLSTSFCLPEKHERYLRPLLVESFKQEVLRSKRYKDY